MSIPIPVRYQPAFFRRQNTSMSRMGSALHGIPVLWKGYSRLVLSEGYDQAIVGSLFASPVEEYMSSLHPVIQVQFITDMGQNLVQRSVPKSAIQWFERNPVHIQAYIHIEPSLQFVNQGRGIGMVKIYESIFPGAQLFF